MKKKLFENIARLFKKLRIITKILKAKNKMQIMFEYFSIHYFPVFSFRLMVVHEPSTLGLGYYFLSHLSFIEMTFVEQ